MVYRRHRIAQRVKRTVCLKARERVYLVGNGIAHRNGRMTFLKAVYGCSIELLKRGAKHVFQVHPYRRMSSSSPSEMENSYCIELVL